MIRKALILGVQGGFGRLFLELLRQEGVAVSGVDRAAGAAAPPACRRYFAEDAALPGEDLLAETGAADALLVCLPERAAFAAFARLVPLLPREALVIDTLSVKGPVAREAARLGCREGQVEWVSLNPLGGPDLGLEGRNVAAVVLSPGPRGKDFLACLARRGARLAEFTPEGHDRQTALTQVVTHCAILAFGLCLGAMEEEPGALPAISTPPFQTLLALWGRMLAQDPEVYWHVQRDNAHGEEARSRFVAKARELQRMIQIGDQEAFQALLDLEKQRLGTRAIEYAKLAVRIFQA